jgi:holo-[acyl-carrier protein] synthase
MRPQDPWPDRVSLDNVSATYAAMVAETTSGAPACPVCHEPTVRVGTDVQGIDAVAAAVGKHGERYLDRVFTSQEVRSSTGGTGTVDASAAASLAARFAVKEAVIKVLRPVDSGVPWPDIEVVRQPGGWSEVALSGLAADVAGAAGLDDWVISFAHDSGVALATVIARHVCGPRRPRQVSL